MIEHIGPAVPYRAEVAAYIADCQDASRQLEARGSGLNPRYHPTAAGAVKMIPHHGDKQAAAAIRQAYDAATAGQAPADRKTATAPRQARRAA